MQSSELFMWWLRDQQKLEQQELQRPVLYAPAPPTLLPMDRLEASEECHEQPRVIIIDL
jgi:hypothetical protein